MPSLHMVTYVHYPIGLPHLATVRVSWFSTWVKSLLDQLRDRRAGLPGAPAVLGAIHVAPVIDPDSVGPSVVSVYGARPARREFNLKDDDVAKALQPNADLVESMARKQRRLQEIERMWLQGGSATHIVRTLHERDGISENTLYKDLKYVQVMIAQIEPATREALYERATEMATEAYRVAATPGPDGKKNPSVMVAATRVVAQLDGLLKDNINVNLGPQVDLSKLTDDELQQYRELQAKVTK